MRSSTLPTPLWVSQLRQIRAGEIADRVELLQCLDHWHSALTHEEFDSRVEGLDHLLVLHHSEPMRLSILASAFSGWALRTSEHELFEIGAVVERYTSNIALIIRPYNRPLFQAILAEQRLDLLLRAGADKVIAASLPSVPSATNFERHVTLLYRSLAHLARGSIVDAEAYLFEALQCERCDVIRYIAPSQRLEVCFNSCADFSSAVLEQLESFNRRLLGGRAPEE